VISLKQSVVVLIVPYSTKSDWAEAVAKRNWFPASLQQSSYAANRTSLVFSCQIIVAICFTVGEPQPLEISNHFIWCQ
jgi:hypothetical protein